MRFHRTVHRHTACHTTLTHEQNYSVLFNFKRNSPICDTGLGVRCEVQALTLNRRGSTFLRNVGTHLPNYTASHPKTRHWKTPKFYKYPEICKEIRVVKSWFTSLLGVHRPLVEGRVQLKYDGTQWRTGWEVKGKLANGVSSQYSSHGVSNITTADAHTSAASSRLNWRPRLFKWTSPFRRKTKSGFCACAITFQTHSASMLPLVLVRKLIIMMCAAVNVQLHILVFWTSALDRSG